MQWLRRTYNGIQRTRMIALYVLVAVVGIAWLGFGVDATLDAWDLERNGERVEGRVVQVDPAHDDDERFVPTYEYRVDGEAYRYTQDNPTVKPAPELGDRRELLVDPDEPREVTSPGFLDVWGGPIALLTFGVLAFLALAYRLRRLLRRGG